MRRAEDMRDAALAQGDRGFGAVVVVAGRIVGHAPSRVASALDPTAHAEIETLRDAARRPGMGDFFGAVLATFRPCPMCEAASYWARIGRMVVARNWRGMAAPALARGQAPAPAP